MDSSKRHKVEGNRFFASKDFKAAITSYRCGLSSLPPTDNGDKNTIVSTSQQKQTEERNKLEVALRSNLALCLIRLAEKNPTRQRAAQLVEYSQEAERECTAVLELEPTSAKMWYRRGHARLLTASHHPGSTSESHDDIQPHDLLSRAESDMHKCEELLQQQLENQKHVKTPVNETKNMIQQIVDARKALQQIETAMLCLNGGVGGIKASSSVSPSKAIDRNVEQKIATETVSETKQTSSQEDGHIIRPVCTTNNSDTSHIIRSNTITNGSYSGNHNPPSPSEQKEQILQLFTRRQSPTHSDTNNSQPQRSFPPQQGEAYFLINMAWWEDWCRYVQFFHSFAGVFNGDEKNKDMIKRKAIEISLLNHRVLEFLPPCATLPPYLEKEKKQALVGKEEKKNDASDSSSSSSDDSDDENEQNNKEAAVPGVIDNSSLILDQCGGWVVPNNSHVDDQNSNGNGNSESSVILRNHLVRGYHFEIVPREVYAALRSWYGEVSPPILRRAQSVDEISWLSRNNPSGVSSRDLSVRLPLYADRWDAISEYSRTSSYNNNTGFICCACRAPFAKSTCTKCKCAHYCNRDCQRNHWSYHKSSCGDLMKQFFADELEAATKALIPDMMVWGRVGLNNLGNTCFMSSALQCMSHVTPLTRFFLSNQFISDKNENNINGTGGKVADAYAALMKDLWMGGHQHSSISPTNIKRAIELFAPRFYGVQQQDSAEFLAYLLDALHEDLNRIRNPPYVQLPDVDRGKKLAICGAETWDALCLRNSSFVFENFYGLYKSTCICPKCEEKSATFESFNHITLEIPRVAKLEKDVLVIQEPGKEDPKLPVKYHVSVQESATVLDLKSSLSAMSGIPASRLRICSVDLGLCNIANLYREDASASLMNGNPLVAYEIAPLNDKSMMHSLITQRRVNENGTIGVIGLPLHISFEQSISCTGLFNIIWAHVKPHVMYARDDIHSDANTAFEELIKANVRVRVMDRSFQNNRMLRTGFDGESTSILPPVSDDKVVDLIGVKNNEQCIYLALEWNEHIIMTEYNDRDQQVHPESFYKITNHTSVMEHDHRARLHGSNAVTLDQCFESFTQPERLDDDNMWYCSRCKDHVKAMKTVALWMLPDILVVHLKRFEYLNAFNRNKIGTLVDFEIDGFDMKKHSAYNCSLGGSRSELVDDEAPKLYDLFGVTNHFGRMGYGHYTAYTRRWNESGMEDKWVEFDDENVNDVDGNAIVSPSAYVLFYRRRSFR